MRYSLKHKQKTHGRIVAKASRMFREKGYAACGIDDIMHAAKLTPGGFYAHFDGKDELFAEALTYCKTDAVRAIASFVKAGRDPLHTWIDYYLNRNHLEMPSTGCPLPTLAGEIARQPAKVRRAFTETIRAYIVTIGAMSPRKPGVHRSDDAIATICILAGAVLISRAVNDRRLSDRILASATRRVLEPVNGTARFAKANRAEPGSRRKTVRRSTARQRP
jgi:TetR/AcrR family transcriptional repressor of nem operon